MHFATAKTGFGKRLGRAFTLGVVPLVAVCLAIGYYRTASATINALRTPWTEGNREALSRQITEGIRASRGYFTGTAALVMVLVLSVWMGRRRQEALGDEMEGLVRRVLHDVSRSLSTIDVEATNVMAGDADARSSAEKIDAISRSEAKKIGSYMLLAKDFAGYDRASSERVNLTAVACRVAADLQMREGHVEVKCSVPEDDLFIQAHPTLVAELVGNLLDNAAKYTEHGTISVSLAACGGNAVLTVADTGRGIPKKDMKHIFNRFYRAGNVSGVQGTGLGLSTVHELVTRQYRGKIKVSSTLGKGTTFTVTLPLSRHRRGNG